MPKYPRQSKPARANPKRKKRKAGKKGKMKRSKIVNLKSGGQMVVFRPRHVKEFFPEKFITTHTWYSRFKCASGLASGLSGLSQYFNLQINQLFKPTLANNNTLFQQSSAMTPAVTFLGDYSNARSSPGYAELANIYDEYTTISSRLEFCMDNLDSSSDSIQVYLIPIVASLNGDVFGFGPITDEQLILNNKYSKRQAYNTYVNEGLSKCVAKVHLNELFGYSTLKDYLDDKYNTCMKTNNPNYRPGNDAMWQISLASNNSTATGSACEFTVKLTQRVCWQTIANPVTV